MTDTVGFEDGGSAPAPATPAPRPARQPTDDDMGPAYMARVEESEVDAIIARAQRKAGGARQPGQGAAPEAAAPERADGGGITATALSAAGDVAQGLFVESPRQIVGGIRDAAQEAIEATSSLAAFLEEKFPLGGIEVGADGVRLLSPEELAARGGPDVPELPEVAEARTATGGAVRGVAQFLTGFIPAMKGLKALGIAPQMVRAAGAGAVADALVFDPHEDRLSNLIQDVPELQNPVTEFLAASPDDTEAEGRFKNALEGLGLGAMTEGFVASVKGIRAARRARADRQGAEAAKAPDAATAEAAADAQVTAQDMRALGNPEAPLVEATGGRGLAPVEKGPAVARARAMPAEARETRQREIEARLGEIEREIEAGRVTPELERELADLEAEGDAIRLAGREPGEQARAAALDRAAADPELAGKARTFLERFGQTGAAGQPSELQRMLAMLRPGGPRPPEPMTLLQFIRQKGGIRADDPLVGDLRAMGITNRTHPGLINRNGRTLDDLAQGAQEEGFFPDMPVSSGARVEIGQLIEGVRNEVAGAPLTREIDEEAQLLRATLADLDETLNRLGIDLDLPDAEIERRLQEAAEARAPAPSADDVAEADIGEPRTLADLEAEAAELAAIRERMTPPDLGGRAVNINLARIQSADDVKEAIAQTANLFAGEIDAARRGVQSNAETEKLASQMGMTVDDLLSRRRGQAFNAEEALAARQVLVASATELTRLARAAMGPNAGEVDQFAFRKALAVHAAIQEQVSGLTAEAGRALQQFRIPAGASAANLRAIREAMQNLGGPDASRQMAALVASLDTPEGLATFARQANRAKSLDMFLEYWINGLLSGPQTHMVNMLSNAAVALWTIPERALAARIGSALGGNGVQVGEAQSAAFGMVYGTRDGFKLAAKALLTGEPSDQFVKFPVVHPNAITGENLAQTIPGRAINRVTRGRLENGGFAARGVDFLGEVLRIPTRFLGAEDEFFKAVGYRQELHAQAHRTAMSEGLAGRAFANRIQEVINNPPEHIRMAAIDASRYQTFTRALGEKARPFQQGLNQVPALRLFLPFFRTPTNIVKFVGVRTPLAPFSKAVRADIAAGGARRDLALARISLGSMLMAVAADLTMSGAITGGGPSDPATRNTLRRSGWQPYSIRFGDRYVAYNRLDPLGMTIGLAADIAEIAGQIDENDPDRDSIAVAGPMAFAKNLTSKTYMRGVSDLLLAVDDPDRYAERFIAGMAGTLIPFTSLVAQVERTLDPTLRETRETGLGDPDLAFYRTVVNEVRDRIPGFSDTLPARPNKWGEPIVLGGGLGPDLISPIYTSEAVSSPIDEELLRLDLNLSMPSRTVMGVELTMREWVHYVKLAGNELKDPSTGLGLRDTLNAIVTGEHPQSAAYQRASDGPDGGKALILRQVDHAFREAAKAQLIEDLPALRQAIEDKARERQRALTVGVE